jgi:bifunctional non-homologous end joining protein LigD
LPSKMITVEGLETKLIHIEKVLFPDDGIAKGDLIDYYRDVSKAMLPHAEGRPLNMQRFPNGIDSQGLMQQPIADYFSRWVNRITLEMKEGGSITHVVCDNAATLVYLANLACLTPHIWRSRAEKLNCPDKMLLDLDPSEGFHQARSGALELKAIRHDQGDPTWQSPWTGGTVSKRLGALPGMQLSFW